MVNRIMPPGRRTGASSRLGRASVALATAALLVGPVQVAGVAATSTVGDEPCGVRPLDVVLILDKSGSMGSSQTASGTPPKTRIAYAKAAATGLVDSLDGNGGVGSRHHVGVTSYGGTTASVNVSLGTSSAATVDAAINGLNASGNTPFKVGMSTGAADLTAHARTTANGLAVEHVLVFLSGEREIRDTLGGGVVSLFGNGCCGNINHVDPTKAEANKTDMIGSSIGRSIVAGLPALVPVEAPRLQVRTSTVDVPLLDATPQQVAAAKQLLGEIKGGAKPDFLAHVDAYRRLIIDNLRHDIDQEEALEWLGWGLSKKLAGSGDTMPLGVQVITLGRDVAVVAFPGESFVEHGLAIKNASPFRTTLVVELANHGETIYVPTRAAAVGGGYETTNTTVAPGAGELMVEACVRLLQEAAAALP
ncbi:MAG: vWA domain-containing protein [Chloroflexota bacterium]